MEITVTIHQVHLSPAERHRLERLNARMARYFRNLMTLRWEIREAGRQYAIHCSVHSRSGYYRVGVIADSAGAALDLAFAKIVRQRRRVHAKQITARNRGGGIRTVAAPTAAGERSWITAR